LYTMRRPHPQRSLAHMPAPIDFKRRVDQPGLEATVRMTTNKVNEIWIVIATHATQPLLVRFNLSYYFYRVTGRIPSAERAEPT